MLFTGKVFEVKQRQADKAKGYEAKTILTCLDDDGKGRKTPTFIECDASSFSPVPKQDDLLRWYGRIISGKNNRCFVSVDEVVPAGK